MGRSFEVRKAAMMKTGLQKTRLYSRFGREIYVTARQGGANLDANLALKHLIERAKKQQVPNDIIKRNIDKAQGGAGEDFVSVRYEGFGPGGSAVLVDALTDNLNRTVSEVRACFTKVGAKLGVKGSVEHMYQHLALLSIRGVDSERVLELLLEADIDVLDIEESEGRVEITGGGYDLDNIQEVLGEVTGLEIIDSEQGWFAAETLVLEGETRTLFEKLVMLLDQCEDVQNVFHNVEL
ncbi:MAG: YebC/PmpR family DNA-binding transcriptional regulator [Acholeplasmatales bacterium]|nr:MAG: YebC/PmpR family DNA-binding transcriptional regulator [Acholeplasmatales bacterium]